MVGRNLKTAFLSFTSRLCVELCKSRQCRSCCGKNQEEWHQSNNKWNGHKAKRGTEKVIAVAVVNEGGKLIVKSGTRNMTLSWKELEEYLGARATRGSLLPRGWQKVDALGSE